ncbi:MAG: 4-hydroxyphenylpyruvate dioxygenase, partial [Microcoleus sp.]
LDLIVKQQSMTGFDLKLTLMTAPNAQFPMPNAPFPIPNYPFPITHYQLPIPNYPFPITHSP